MSLFFLCDGRGSCSNGNSLSVENLRPSWVSVRLDCLHVGLLETLCCIGRLLHDETLLTDSLGCPGLWKKSSSGEALPVDSSQEPAIWCGSNVSVKPHLFVHVYVQKNKREREREENKKPLPTRLADPATSTVAHPPDTQHTQYS